MKIIKYKDQLIVVIHLLFWILSINIWNIVFNPGVESSGVIKGLQDYWPDLVLLYTLFYLYCLLPFVWFIGKAKKWLKISVTVLFFIPVVYLFFEFLHPVANRDDISLFTEFFLSGFMYVVVFHLTIAAAVYFNLYILINRYLKVSQFGSYILAVGVLTICTAIANFAIFDFIIDKIFPGLYFVSYFKIWELIIIVGGYLLFATLVFLVWQYAVLLIANRDKAQNELSALKAQINPHFLFNNLNTIYSMAINKDERTKDIILQLSDFLRYVLYDTTSEFIPLDKEVEIIRTYVELQKARINPEKTTVELTITGDFGDKQIAPLLLLPLAENCFKHGIGKEPGKIEMNIGLKGSHLHFTTKNAVALREMSENEVNGGIGINNVEKRLNLLYSGRHSLHFEEIGGIYSVRMDLEL